MEDKILLLDKPVSLTPHQAIENFRALQPKYKNVKLGYAGRLDPMAEGLLLVLVGEENKFKKKYEDLSKVYEFTVLFGVKSDTLDILGLAQKNAFPSWSVQDGKNLSLFLKNLPGKKNQEYPAYSSKTVNGIPLYKWAREDKLKKIKIPSHEISIKSIKLSKTSHITSTELWIEINERIKPLKGDFRQEEILEKWENILSIKSVFTLKYFTISCSSGTYVRSIAREMGEFLHKDSLAYEIKRVSIGNYDLKDAFPIKKPA